MSQQKSSALGSAASWQRQCRCSVPSPAEASYLEPGRHAAAWDLGGL